jgi:hypothetical protein
MGSIAADDGDGQRRELLRGVPVLGHGGIVHSEEAACRRVEHPHRLGMFEEHAPEARFVGDEGALAMPADPAQLGDHPRPDRRRCDLVGEEL